MPAGVLVLDAAMVIVGSSSEDISERVEKVTLSINTKSVEMTGMTLGWRQVKPSKIKGASLKIDLFQDYSTDTTNDVKQALYDSITAGVPFTVVVRPTTEDRAANNPDFSGSFVNDGDFALIDGAVGQANKTSVNLMLDGTLSILTSSS